jgi:hypothetical protein
MAKILKLDRFAQCISPQSLDDHRFLTVCIEKLEKQLREVRAEKDQDAIKEILQLLAFARRELGELHIAP